MHDAREDLRENYHLACPVVAQTLQLHQHLLQNLLQRLRAVRIRVVLIVVRTNGLLVTQLAYRNELERRLVPLQNLKVGRHFEDSLGSVDYSLVYFREDFLMSIQQDEQLVHLDQVQ